MARVFLRKMINLNHKIEYELLLSVGRDNSVPDSGQCLLYNAKGMLSAQSKSDNLESRVHI
jgi:hypothetical protein